jgi:hypothetical protein
MQATYIVFKTCMTSKQFKFYDFKLNSQSDLIFFFMALGIVKKFGKHKNDRKNNKLKLLN